MPKVFSGEWNKGDYKLYILKNKTLKKKPVRTTTA